MVVTRTELTQIVDQVNKKFDELEAKIKELEGKAKVKVTSSGRRVSYGQAGKAKDGGPRVRPGTSKGDSYCARSLGIKKRLPKKKQNDPNTPNNLSRKRWKCKGAKSMRANQTLARKTRTRGK